MIVYEPLWKTMKEKKVSQYLLIKTYGISCGQLDRLKKNQYVSSHTIGVLCTILNCAVEDVLEFRMDNSEYAFPSPEMYEEHIREDAEKAPDSGGQSTDKSLSVNTDFGP